MTQITTTGKAHELITFSRASNGTALRKISYGPELVTNGTFDNDATGATPATWETNNASASLIKQADGTALFSSTSFAYARIKAASRPVLPAGVYEVSFDITDWVSGLNLVHVGIGSAGNIIGGNGSYSYLYPATVEQAYEFQIRPNGGGTGSFKIDNISVKKVLFDQPDGTLKLFNHFADTPRIEYNSDGTVKGLLIEEQRTNLVTYSEDFTNASWVKSNTTVTANAAVAPDGASTADLLYPASSGSYRSLRIPAYAPWSGQKTASIYLKFAGIRYVRAVSGTASASTDLAVDLVSGTVSNVVAGVSASLTPAGNDWYLLQWAQTDGRLYLYLADNENTTNVTAGGTSGIYVWGAQLEEGAFPTSYIPTSGATATRSPDIASVPVSAFGYNQDQGTVVVEFDSNGSDGADYPRVFSLSNTSGTDLTRFLINPTNTTTVAVITAGSGVALTGWSGSISENTTETVAVAIKKDSFAASLSGAATQEDTSGNMPAASNLLTIGTQSNLANNFLNGHIKSIQYYPVRLANAQLQEITS